MNFDSTVRFMLDVSKTLKTLEYSWRQNSIQENEKSNIIALLRTYFQPVNHS